jgi:hypothetical protein
VGGDWYYKLEGARNFQETVDICIKIGGQLAVIYDQVTHDAMYQLTGIIATCFQVFLFKFFSKLVKGHNFLWFIFIFINFISQSMLEILFYHYLKF